MGPIPCVPDLMAFQNFSTPVPMHVTTPMPVTATRRPLPFSAMIDALCYAPVRRRLMSAAPLGQP